METQEVIDKLKLKFSSGNDIPVSRATLTLDEWDVILKSLEWQPMETAPKDRPIVAMCKEECSGELCGKDGRLCLYHAHSEGMSCVGTGYAIVEWGGEWDDRTYDNPNAGYLPDWWFRVGSDFEEAANPICWKPL